ncbi:hypothetical protein JS531_04140 [Bifidobacterium sp. CP2]|uniref:hypothetical protein n=1 Tax=Bifidobacterium TaxID=1678 RepID=UPI001BDCE962|nr:MULTISPECIES: hypothetical protein [Bifidobacterium]MBT1181174.1 hypothetical protein [Bifidobacterium sp. CP2]MBW3079846.1 hypothetical protein [Bifidobacterium saguinibicoloris]
MDDNDSGIDISSLTDKQLADLYYDTFGTWYPFIPDAFPVFFKYGGIDCDPQFRDRAITAISTKTPLPELPFTDDPPALY